MSNSPNFQDEPLSEHDHLDPAKHFIGEALPAPSLAETKYAGIATSTGTSPFPARADHSHDSRTIFGVYSRTANFNVAAGASSYINGITFSSVGDDIRVPASTQLFEFSQEGLWSIHMLFTISRQTGTFPANIPYRMSFEYDNATTQLYIIESNLPEARARIVDTCIDQPWILNFGTMQNVQFRYWNFDSVGHNINLTRLQFVRQNSLVNP